MLPQDIRNEVILLCQELIRNPSISGNEQGVVEVLKKYMFSKGFVDIHVDCYGSITGCLKGNRPGKKILLDGHIDTVPVPNPQDWAHHPFSGEISDGKVYGRGASDMKGAVASMACAASWVASKTRGNFSGEIYLAGVVHEECFEGIAAREISKKINPDYVIIGEASEGNLKIGQRGRAEILLETFGKPAHSASPEKGINAVHSMLNLISKIEALHSPEQAVLGKGICVLTDIISTPYPGSSVVPSHCKATYDRRLLVGETPESVLAPILNIINKLTSEDNNFKGKASFAHGKENCYTGNIIESDRFFPAWLFSDQEPFVQRAFKSLQQAGLHPQLSHYAFCTNGSHYAGERGINTLGYGPSLETLAHTIDEYILEDHLAEGVVGYSAIIESLLN